MKTLRRAVRPLAAAAAVGLVAVACTNDDPQVVDTPAPSATEMTDEPAPAAGDPFALLFEATQAVGNNGGSAAAIAGALDRALDLDGDVNSPAATTYAQLSTLLQEHVYLAGIAVVQAYHTGPDSPEFALAAGALDLNSVELADLIGTVDASKRDAFLELWRQHIGFFVDYALGAAADDQAMIDQAKDDLAGYGVQSGAFFEELSGGVIPADAVEGSLAMHVETLGAAIESAAAGDGRVFDLLKEAAAHTADMSAKALAAGLDAALELDGDVESAASTTLQTVSTLLEEHVLLAGIAVRTAYVDGADSANYDAIVAELDENSVELADVIGSVDGDKRDPFLALWREHIGFFVNYALGAAAGDQAMIDQAKADLANYGQQAGAFFEELSGGELPSADVQAALQVHVDTLGAAIEALAAALVG